MQRFKLLFAVLSGIVIGAFLFSLNGLMAGEAPQAPKYPLDEQLAKESAPWTLKGKWGERGNWGRWGEEDKRGMLHFITPEMIVKAAGLVKQGKVYALGEEMHNDVPRLITPVRFGPQILQERDGYDRITKPVNSTPNSGRGRPVTP